jgi:hypothetical protein
MPATKKKQLFVLPGHSTLNHWKLIIYSTTTTRTLSIATPKIFKKTIVVNKAFLGFTIHRKFNYLCFRGNQSLTFLSARFHDYYYCRATLFFIGGRFWVISQNRKEPKKNSDFSQVELKLRENPIYELKK